MRSQKTTFAGLQGPFLAGGSILAVWIGLMMMPTSCGRSEPPPPHPAWDAPATTATTKVAPEVATSPVKELVWNHPKAACARLKDFGFDSMTGWLFNGALPPGQNRWCVGGRFGKEPFADHQFNYYVVGSDKWAEAFRLRLQSPRNVGGAAGARAELARMAAKLAETWGMPLNKNFAPFQAAVKAGMPGTWEVDAYYKVEVAKVDGDLVITFFDRRSKPTEGLAAL
jgi:hypothetical protein